MADTSRIAELERLVQEDPTSIAFAQLADEYRRAGRFEEAVRVCRAGLSRCSEFPSARLTLGRALLALGQRAEAEDEFERLVREGPDHLAARRACEELQRLRGGEAVPGDAQRVRDAESIRELQSWLDAIATDRATRIHSAPMDSTGSPTT